MNGTDQVEKVCTKCGDPKAIEEFCKDAGYQDGRRSDCNDCRQLARSAFRQSLDEATAVPQGFTASTGRRSPSMQRHPVPTAYAQAVLEKDLPDPEVLPAAYMKRVSDYWVDLTGGEEPATRIA